MSPFSVLLVLLAQAAGPGGLTEPPLHPVPFTEVNAEGFWRYWIDLTPRAILPHCVSHCTMEGKLGNFLVASGAQQGKHRGACWEDSDVYKVIEGAAYCLAIKPDAELQAQFDGIIDTIVAAQQPDGYLNTYFTLVEPGNRWNDDTKHETYCAGHLIEAAIAYHEATGRRVLLDAAIRLANHMYDVFGPGKQTDVSEHEEIELALVKLWRVTKDDRYLELSRLFLERRGHQEGRKPVPQGSEGGWGEVCQDHKPIVEQDAIVGHAVRAMYLYCAVTDHATMTGNPAYLKTLDSIWDDVVGRKMYVTGGIGDASRSNEGFSVPYYLPNDTAYCETCASVGMALWNQRMALMYADARYADIVELELYNGILGSTSLEGRAFYYCNRLQGNDHRPPWQGCACCPTNIVRLFPAVAGFAYATGPKGIYVNQYISGRAAFSWDGRGVTLVQQTQYPWDGQITIRPEISEKTHIPLHLRIPGWSRNARTPGDLYRYTGRDAAESARFFIGNTEIQLRVAKGYAVLDREWLPGETLRIEIPMPVLRVHAHPNVEANRDRVALQRGPLVYCFEDIDNAGNVARAGLPKEAQILTAYQSKMLNGVVMLTTSGVLSAKPEAKAGECKLKAIPFYARDNRTQTYMQVWMPEIQ